MKEVELFPDDPKSAECIKQLEQVSSMRDNAYMMNNRVWLFICCETAYLITCFCFRRSDFSVTFNTQTLCSILVVKQ